MDIQYKRNQLLSRFSKESLKFTVLEESKGRTNDIDELTEEELSSIFFMLFPSKRIITPERRLLNLEEEKKIRHLRSIILSDAQYIGLYKPNNWTDFNAFMLKKSILKKPLNNYKINEFANLIKQFKAMKSKYDSNKFIPGTKEWYEFIGFRPSLN
ncbi:hypothetical protein [Tenacibaculum maritimum]|uniref:hypothetical protein n=1 Tax=Tenacibaculum maritimum TaxID=107401 RepID=UPI0013305FEF|nr:hypothetical protein [Tenacibaculum maritimum]